MINLTVNCDGGSRGNPGHAGIGILIKKEKDVLGQMTGELDNQVKISKYIGEATNNQAEYAAVLEALKYLKENFAGIDIAAEFLLDSQLVVEQLNGNYKIKNEGLKPLFWEVRELILALGGKIDFQHVPREENKIADELVNQAIDEALMKGDQ